MKIIDADAIPFFTSYVADADAEEIVAYKEDIDSLPELDVDLVIPAYWIHNEREFGEAADSYGECSNCHQVYYVDYGTTEEHYRYCPNCGCYMRGDRK